MRLLPSVTASAVRSAGAASGVIRSVRAVLVLGDQFAVCTCVVVIRFAAGGAASALHAITADTAKSPARVLIFMSSPLCLLFRSFIRRSLLICERFLRVQP